MAWPASPHALGLPQRPSILTGSRAVSVSGWRQPCTGAGGRVGLAVTLPLMGLFQQGCHLPPDFTVVSLFLHL